MLIYRIERDGDGPASGRMTRTTSSLVCADRATQAFRMEDDAAGEDFRQWKTGLEQCLRRSVRLFKSRPAHPVVHAGAAASSGAGG